MNMITMSLLKPIYRLLLTLLNPDFTTYNGGVERKTGYEALCYAEWPFMMRQKQ